METNFDAIVIGTGISGGWAAKELCEKGLKTLVLERGRMIKHIEDYKTANTEDWEFPAGDVITQEIKKRQPKQSRTGYVNTESTKDFFVDDIEHTYNEKERFDWIRGYHVGGRSLLWARQSYRLTPYDFIANKNDGYGVDWPIRYKDLAPWYDYVENYIGVSGENLNLNQFPDQKLLKPMELNCVEKVLQKSISNKYSNRHMTIGRVAHITEGTKPGLGRSNCQFRNRCRRGCPYGAYFSSNSSTLPAAAATGNMTLRPNSIVYEIIYDEQKKKASGVKIIDSESNLTYEFKSKIIFMCASTVPTTSILMQSKSNRFPNGLGNDSGELGHNVMDHHFQIGADASCEGFEDKYYTGRRPNGIYIPRFQNIGGKTNTKKFLRGYGYQGGASRTDWKKYVKEASYGENLKQVIIKPGKWTMGLNGFGEVLPYHENKMYLSYDNVDKWGLPTVTFDAKLRENELNMRKDMQLKAMEMLDNAGFKDVKPMESSYGLGLGIHEMGTARMGKDPKTSVLNAFNQIHSVKNIFITDGSSMTSSGNVNPSLTYMALTARAVDYAVKELKNNKL
ncbi:MAG: GMC family oxidoreductase [Flavobacteriaceae bacterium]